MCSMVSGNNSFHLEWNNHLGNMQAVLESLYTNQSLVDVTIACRDGVLKAHKVILSACSPYFEAVFQETPCKHPVLILKGVSVHEMQALLRFMYRGQVDVPEAELSAVIATACEFKVKGFSVDGIPSCDEYRPDSVSEHESEMETPLDNNQPRVSIHNWKDDTQAESSVKNNEKLSSMIDEMDVTPVIVESQSLQKDNEEETVDKNKEKEEEEGGGGKEEEEGEEQEQEANEEEEDKKPNAEELAASLKALKSAQPATEGSASAATGPTASATPNAAAAAVTAAAAAATAASASVATSSSNCSTTSSSSSAVSNSATATANSGEATPYRRETRYKGQKRVDVGIRPAAGRTRSVDKRESSAAGAETRSSSTYSSQSAKKLRVGASSRKSDLSAISELPLPSPDRIEDKKLILESSAVDISITRTGNSMLDDGSSPFVKIKAEAESADEEDDDEEATADMFCIPHLQELPDTDGADPLVPGEEVDMAPRWSVHAPPPSLSGREQRTVVEAPAEEGEGDMACPYCFTRCPRFSDLKRHMRLHTEDKPHECEFCSLAFARASHLARHRRTHTGERPFRCPAPSCERTFSRQDKLKLHTQRAHPGLPCDLVQSGTYMRIRGRRRIREKNLPLGLRLGIAPSLAPTNSTSSLSAASSSQSAASAGPAVISLPFGDTSYLTSLSLGQQRYSDLTISPVTAGSSGTSGGSGGTSSGAGAEELLKSVRQLGECTIQTLPSKVLAE